MIIKTIDMKSIAATAFILASVAISSATTMTTYNSTTSTSPDAVPAPNNTALNQQDLNSGATTADTAGQSTTDRTLMRKIRHSVFQDSTLSTDAHNVKIIANNGEVTLKGPVKSEEEKKKIETKAIEIAGRGHVTNDLSIAK